MHTRRPFSLCGPPGWYIFLYFQIHFFKVGSRGGGGEGDWVPVLLEIFWARRHRSNLHQVSTEIEMASTEILLTLTLTSYVTRNMRQGGQRPLCHPQGAVWVRAARAIPQTGQSLMMTQMTMIKFLFSRWKEPRSAVGTAPFKPPKSSLGQFLHQVFSRQFLKSSCVDSQLSQLSRALISFQV